ncbi:cysteine proteinase [Myriangium duriaei CBS 260.36]|uniref:ubiquitinyl hydrolase 1 n=1 Tax=Myriangium duriaei CBS 260.36 TaxID=1168546 RepID=A0A9P4JAG7_9PEZI|nr:cysteine proteinase [Myriangium duriaei CBS 260.36]
MPSTSDPRSKSHKSPLLNGVLGAEPVQPILGEDGRKHKAPDMQNGAKTKKRAPSPQPLETKAARKLVRLTKQVTNGDNNSNGANQINGTRAIIQQTQPTERSSASIPQTSDNVRPLTNGIKHEDRRLSLTLPDQIAGNGFPAKLNGKSKKSAVPTVSGKWPFKTGKPRRQGLSNPGAWCYRRALLQCFMSTPQFYNVVTNAQHAKCPPNCVPCALRKLTESYHRDASQTRNNLKQLDQTTKMPPAKGRPRWRSNNVFSQEDTHEYMLYLLNSLNSTQCIRTPALRQSFQIAHRASWTCQDCHRTHTHDDPAGWSISLPIHATHGTASLATCMDRYHGAARLTIRCDACKTNKPRLRGSKISQLPEVLLVHLLRFTPGLRGMRKNTARVAVPDEVDVKQWTVDGLGRTRYSLNAMLYHSGGLDNGHYIARVKSAAGIELMDDASPPQRVKGWYDNAGGFTPYVLVFLRQ